MESMLREFAALRPANKKTKTRRRAVCSRTRDRAGKSRRNAVEKQKLDHSDDEDSSEAICVYLAPDQQNWMLEVDGVTRDLASVVSDTLASIEPKRRRLGGKVPPDQQWSRANDSSVEEPCVGKEEADSEVSSPRHCSIDDNPSPADDIPIWVDSYDSPQKRFHSEEQSSDQSDSSAQKLQISDCGCSEGEQSNFDDREAALQPSVEDAKSVDSQTPSDSAPLSRATNDANTEAAQVPLNTLAIETSELQAFPEVVETGLLASRGCRGGRSARGGSGSPWRKGRAGRSGGPAPTAHPPQKETGIRSKSVFLSAIGDSPLLNAVAAVEQEKLLQRLSQFLPVRSSVVARAGPGISVQVPPVTRVTPAPHERISERMEFAMLVKKAMQPLRPQPSIAQRAVEKAEFSLLVRQALL